VRQGRTRREPVDYGRSVLTEQVGKNRQAEPLKVSRRWVFMMVPPAPFNPAVATANVTLSEDLADFQADKEVRP
jgi:hypothetical protein